MIDLTPQSNIQLTAKDIIDIIKDLKKKHKDIPPKKLAEIPIYIGKVNDSLLKRGELVLLADKENHSHDEFFKLVNKDSDSQYAIIIY